MKLSEAMREGAKLRPQVFEEYNTLTPEGVIGSCAMAAAYEGFFGKLAPIVQGPFADPVEVEILEAMGLDEEPTIKDAPHALRCGDLFCSIANLNDGEHWTREEIADWLERLGY